MHTTYPSTSSATSQNGTSVFVIGPDNVAEQRDVVLGYRFSEQLQILSGIESGEKIVVEGIIKVHPGVKVRLSQDVNSAQQAKPDK